MLRHLLGLREDQPLPKPMVVLEMFARIMPVALVKEYQVHPSGILGRLASQGVLGWFRNG